MVQRLPPLEVGTRVGDWVVIEQEVSRASGSQKPGPLSRVLCVCGTEKIHKNTYLLAGKSTGCGCRRGRALAYSRVKHNKSQTPLYRLWASVKHRLVSDRAYEGVRMHEPWVCDFEAFETFIQSLGPKPTPAHSLDRIEPDGDYAPGNLRWADKTIQSVNRRNSMLRNLVQNSIVKVGQKYDMLTVLDVFVREKHGRNWYAAKVQCECGTVKTVYQKQLLSPKTKSCGCYKNRNLRLGPSALEKPIEASGDAKSMAAWARELGVSRQVLWQRMRRHGWSAERAVTESLRESAPVEINGESLTVPEWSERHGVPPHIIGRRLAKGWDPFEAVTTPVRAWGLNRG